jgi:hypothetical protein
MSDNIIDNVSKITVNLDSVSYSDSASFTRGLRESKMYSQETAPIDHCTIGNYTTEAECVNVGGVWADLQPGDIWHDTDGETYGNEKLFIYSLGEWVPTDSKLDNISPRVILGRSVLDTGEVEEIKLSDDFEFNGDVLSLRNVSLDDPSDTTHNQVSLAVLRITGSRVITVIDGVMMCNGRPLRDLGVSYFNVFLDHFGTFPWRNNTAGFKNTYSNEHRYGMEEGYADPLFRYQFHGDSPWFNYDPNIYKDEFRLISEQGYRFVRSFCTPWLPVDYDDVFFNEPRSEIGKSGFYPPHHDFTSVHTRWIPPIVPDPKRMDKYFDTTKEILDTAYEHGLGIGMTLFGRFQSVPEMSGETTSYAIHHPNSKSKDLWSEIIHEFMTRLGNHPSIAWWGISNELNIRSSYTFWPRFDGKEDFAGIPSNMSGWTLRGATKHEDYVRPSMVNPTTGITYVTVEEWTAVWREGTTKTSAKQWADIGTPIPEGFPRDANGNVIDMLEEINVGHELWEDGDIMTPEAQIVWMRWFGEKIREYDTVRMISSGFAADTGSRSLTTDHYKQRLRDNTPDPVNTFVTHMYPAVGARIDPLYENMGTILTELNKFGHAHGKPVFLEEFGTITTGELFGVIQSEQALSTEDAIYAEDNTFASKTFITGVKGIYDSGIQLALAWNWQRGDAAIAVDEPNVAGLNNPIFHVYNLENKTYTKNEILRWFNWKMQHEGYISPKQLQVTKLSATGFGENDLCANVSPLDLNFSTRKGGSKVSIPTNNSMRSIDRIPNVYHNEEFGKGDGSSTIFKMPSKLETSRVNDAWKISVGVGGEILSTEKPMVPGYGEKNSPYYRPSPVMDFQGKSSNWTIHQIAGNRVLYVEDGIIKCEGNPIREIGLNYFSGLLETWDSHPFRTMRNTWVELWEDDKISNDYMDYQGKGTTSWLYRQGDSGNPYNTANDYAKEFKVIAEQGYRFLRVHGLPWFPADFDMVYYDTPTRPCSLKARRGQAGWPYPAIEYDPTRNKRFWLGYKAFLDSAFEFGLGIGLSIPFHLWTLNDLSGYCHDTNGNDITFTDNFNNENGCLAVSGNTWSSETLSNGINTEGSALRVLTEKLVKDIWDNVGNHPAFSWWGMGNELNIHSSNTQYPKFNAVAKPNIDGHMVWWSNPQPEIEISQLYYMGNKEDDWQASMINPKTINKIDPSWDETGSSQSTDQTFACYACTNIKMNFKDECEASVGCSNVYLLDQVSCEEVGAEQTYNIWEYEQCWVFQPSNKSWATDANFTDEDSCITATPQSNVWDVQGVWGKGRMYSGYNEWNNGPHIKLTVSEHGDIVTYKSQAKWQEFMATTIRKYDKVRMLSNSGGGPSGFRDKSHKSWIQYLMADSPYPTDTLCYHRYPFGGAEGSRAYTHLKDELIMVGKAGLAMDPPRALFLEEFGTSKSSEIGGYKMYDNDVERANSGVLPMDGEIYNNTMFYASLQQVYHSGIQLTLAWNWEKDFIPASVSTEEELSTMVIFQIHSQNTGDESNKKNELMRYFNAKMRNEGYISFANLMTTKVSMNSLMGMSGMAANVGIDKYHRRVGEVGTPEYYSGYNRSGGTMLVIPVGECRDQYRHPISEVALSEERCLAIDSTNMWIPDPTMVSEPTPILNIENLSFATGDGVTKDFVLPEYMYWADSPDFELTLDHVNVPQYFIHYDTTISDHDINSVYYIRDDKELWSNEPSGTCSDPNYNANRLDCLNASSNNTWTADGYYPGHKEQSSLCFRDNHIPENGVQIRYKVRVDPQAATWSANTLHETWDTETAINISFWLKLNTDENLLNSGSLLDWYDPEDRIGIKIVLSANALEGSLQYAEEKEFCMNSWNLYDEVGCNNESYAKWVTITDPKNPQEGEDWKDIGSCSDPKYTNWWECWMNEETWDGSHCRNEYGHSNYYGDPTSCTDIGHSTWKRMELTRTNFSHVPSITDDIPQVAATFYFSNPTGDCIDDVTGVKSNTELVHEDDAASCGTGTTWTRGTQLQQRAGGSHLEPQEIKDGWVHYSFNASSRDDTTKGGGRLPEGTIFRMGSGTRGITPFINGGYCGNLNPGGVELDPYDDSGFKYPNFKIPTKQPITLFGQWYDAWHEDAAAGENKGASFWNARSSFVQMKDLRIFNKTLQDDEVRELYLRGNAPKASMMLHLRLDGDFEDSIEEKHLSYRVPERIEFDQVPNDAGILDPQWGCFDSNGQLVVDLMKGLDSSGNDISEFITGYTDEDRTFYDRPRHSYDCQSSSLSDYSTTNQLATIWNGGDLSALCTDGLQSEAGCMAHSGYCSSNSSYLSMEECINAGETWVGNNEWIGPKYYHDLLNDGVKGEFNKKNEDNIWKYGNKESAYLEPAIAMTFDYEHSCTEDMSITNKNACLLAGHTWEEDKYLREIMELKHFSEGLKFAFSTCLHKDHINGPSWCSDSTHTTESTCLAASETWNLGCYDAGYTTVRVTLRGESQRQYGYPGEYLTASMRFANRNKRSQTYTSEDLFDPNIGTSAIPAPEFVEINALDAPNSVDWTELFDVENPGFLFDTEDYTSAWVSNSNKNYGLLDETGYEPYRPICGFSPISHIYIYGDGWHIRDDRDFFKEAPSTTSNIDVDGKLVIEQDGYYMSGQQHSLIFDKPPEDGANIGLRMEFEPSVTKKVSWERGQAFAVSFWLKLNEDSFDHNQGRHIISWTNPGVVNQGFIIKLSAKMHTNQPTESTNTYKTDEQIVHYDSVHQPDPNFDEKLEVTMFAHYEEHIVDDPDNYHHLNTIGSVQPQEVKDGWVHYTFQLSTYDDTTHFGGLDIQEYDFDTSTGTRGLSVFQNGEQSFVRQPSALDDGTYPTYSNPVGNPIVLFGGTFSSTTMEDGEEMEYYGDRASFVSLKDVYILGQVLSHSEARHLYRRHQPPRHSVLAYYPLNGDFKNHAEKATIPSFPEWISFTKVDPAAEELRYYHDIYCSMTISGMVDDVAVGDIIKGDTSGAFAQITDITEVSIGGVDSLEMYITIHIESEHGRNPYVVEYTNGSWTYFQVGETASGSIGDIYKFPRNYGTIQAFARRISDTITTPSFGGIDPDTNLELPPIDTPISLHGRWNGYRMIGVGQDGIVPSEANSNPSAPDPEFVSVDKSEVKDMIDLIELYDVNDPSVVRDPNDDDDLPSSGWLD